MTSAPQAPDAKSPPTKTPRADSKSVAQTTDKTTSDLLRDGDGGFAVGQPVRVRVDAFPGRDFKARVDSFQLGSGSRFSILPAENATGNYVKVVQRVPVKVVFDDLKQVAQYGLGPGMSVVPTVKVSEPGRPSAAAASAAVP